MKRLFPVIFFLIAFLPVSARHVVGGEIRYTYIGPGASPNTKSYLITVLLFRDSANCNPDNMCSDMPAQIRLAIFSKDNNSRFAQEDINRNNIEHVNIIYRPPCLANEPFFAYQVGYYYWTVELPNNNAGYTVTYQTCCRVQNIDNVGNGNNISVGAAYTAEIPGLSTLAANAADNSPRFQVGISIVCAGSVFKLDFSATDPDGAGDSLVYSFANAYDGGSITDAGLHDPAAPAYNSIPYSSPYSAASPLGSGGTINSATGIISGIAPPSGKYVVCVVVKTYRNHVFLAQHRKDFIVTVAPCTFPDADLDITNSTCDGLNVTFHNNNTNPLNLTYDWLFDDPASGANNTSTLESPPHTFTAPGDYHVRLIVNAGTPCADTAYTLQRVWPGFFPAFAPIPPMCKDLPVQFQDATTANFGSVNFWRWDFGDQTVTNDTSHLPNPVYTYHTAGTYNAEFIVATDKGCRDTLYPVVTIVDKPDFTISKDTLICIVDTLQLHSNVTTGTITWSPNYMIDDIHSFNPLVSPDVTTVYTANYLDPFGCSGSAQVKINVVSGVTLSGIHDTTICRTDTAMISLTTNALYFNWTPPNLFIDATVQNPQYINADPLNSISVHASISAKCFADTTINVKTVPYPVPGVSGDERICYGFNAQLHATGGSIYTWSPPAYLNNPYIADPLSVAPKASLTYTVYVRDTLGCPKPVSKDFHVEVIRLFANAGPADTSVVLGQPLLLSASGGTFYHWDPVTYLDDPNIRTPTSLPQNNITYTVEASNDIGCRSIDTIRVHVFFLEPGLYVPSAFTPGKDNLNDLFRPIALGIRTLEYFRIYNRWGVLLYQTSRINDGWDGKYKGAGQDPATYVWEASAIDYTGKKIFRKGSVILIR